MPVAVPAQWPKEVSLHYQPVRVLGVGGFGSVMLCRRKQENKDPDAAANDEKDKLVAVKVVGSDKVTTSEVGYAHRELDILSQVVHPNIMRLIRYWEPAREEHLCAAVMILSYSPGATLHALLQKGGALGLVCARVVCAQLLDALTYCHSRVVVHRDIKADNVIIKASIEHDEIWDDNDKGEKSPDEWKALTAKWHVTLIDFGFARALTPADMKKKPRKSVDSSDSLGNSGSSRRSLNKSVSRLFTRRMSALGNRDYAAPEIKNKVVKLTGPSSHHSGVNITHTISDHVAHYGLLADAYSAGVLIRYVLTGVPPHLDLAETLALQNNPLMKLGRLFGGRKMKKNAVKPKRRVRYRGVDKIPAEVVRLIKGMTHYDPTTRTSIRMSRRYPWIADVLEGDGPGLREVNYLEFAKEPTDEDK
jgi:serine/threonine protein kinase